MTVAWIDTLATGRNFGRGVLMRGRWATKAEAPPRFPSDPPSPTVPIDAPQWALNDHFMKLFNFAYYWKQPQLFREGIVSPDAWWYPLDAIRHWNRIYGPKGFLQYQCVLPGDDGPAALCLH